MKHLKTWALLLLYPIAVWAISNPIKILLPQTAGVVCAESWLCVEDLERLEEARRLYLTALGSVESKLSPLNGKPLMVFCTTQRCFERFGFGDESGQSVGGFGVVIAPKGWQRHIVEHELIHQWQVATFGVLDTWLAPRWITEGMAYALSDDPREALPEPYQGYREKFLWNYADVAKEKLPLALAGGF